MTGPDMELGVQTCDECGAYVDNAEKHDMWHLTLADLIMRSLPWKRPGE